MMYRYFDSEKGRKGKKKLGSSGRSCGWPSRFCNKVFTEDVFHLTDLSPCGKVLYPNLNVEMDTIEEIVKNSRKDKYIASPKTEIGQTSVERPERIPLQML